MSKSEKIRELFAPAATELDLDGVEGSTGFDRNFLHAILGQMVKRDELLVREKDGAKHYRRNPDYTPKRGAPPQERPTSKGTKPTTARKEKPMKKKSAKKKQQRKRRARAVNKAKPRIGAEQATVQILALDNYLGACAQLRRAVNAEVPEIEDDSLLATALANHERAEKLYDAARGA